MANDNLSYKIPKSSRFVDVSGMKFNNLLVDSFAFVKNGTSYFKCLCDCGNYKTIRYNSIKSGKAKSCGCIQKQIAKTNAKSARNAKQKNAPILFERFWSKVDIKSVDQCWNWKACVRKKKEGYGAFFFNGRNHPAQRIAWILSFGDYDFTNLCVCHTCDNPSCCNPMHLFLGTNQQNNNDKVNKKRHAYGSKNGTSKLNENSVIEIRKYYFSRKGANNIVDRGVVKELSEKYNVSSSTIHDAVTRRWGHV